MIELTDLLRHLKKRHIEKTVLLLRILFTIVPIAVAFFTIRSTIKEYLENKTLVSKFISETSSVKKELVNDDSQAANLRDLNSIVEKNLFGPLTLPTPPGGGQPVVKPANKTAFALVGTYVGGGEPSSAIIEDSKKAVQDVFLIDETIFGEAKLLSVYSDHVEILRGTEKEILKLEDGGSGGSGQTATGGGATNGGEIVVAEADVDNALANLPLLLTEIRAVPYFKDGQAIGLRLFAIKQGSVFEKIGLKNGDILKTINGTSMGDFTQAVKLFERLKAERNLKVSLERNREEQEYAYVIK